jgi:hypothetical protein
MHSPFEIHVHGGVLLQPQVSLAQVEDALKPLWGYAGARSLKEGSGSSYPEEPGIRFDAINHQLNMCWTVSGDMDIRNHLDEMCMALNELVQTAAAIEVSFYDAEFDEAMEDEELPDDAQSRDDFVMLFVGPDPQSIMQLQRDMMINDVVHLMERHFDAAELAPVVQAIDGLFEQRYSEMVNSLDIHRIMRGPSGGGGFGGHGNGRKPRHLH